MNVNPISMDRNTALKKYYACIDERHADSYEYAQQCAEAYRLLAEGKKLISLSASIKNAGLNAKGFPNLAIARSDRKEVHFSWRRGSSLVRFSSAANPHSGIGANSPELNRVVDMGATNFPFPDKWSLEGYAMVPAVPADVRPEIGMLRDWYTLWEVDEWVSQSRFARAPHDPLLLEHVGGDLYAVLAQWDLTEVERLVLEGM